MTRSTHQTFLASAPLRLLLAVALATSFASGLGAAAEPTIQVKVPPPPPLAHFRVMWMQNPAETAMVSWTTPVEGKTHTVHYDTQSRQRKLGEYAFKASALPSRKYTMLPVDAGTPEGWAQNVLLEKLEPATTYHFVIESDGVVSREFHFVTAPADDRPVKLLYGADSRPGRFDGKAHLTRRSINRLIASLVEEHPDIVALAHGGDYDSYGQWRSLREWLSDHELTITKAGRILPIIPARGNHEGKQGQSTFEEVFHSPALATPYYYATTLSARAVLVTLNTQASKGGDQRDWLDAELARHREVPGKWIVMQYHVPAYPSVKPVENGAQQRLHWVPLFEKHRVSLVCEADDHMLKRTVPIYQDQHDPERGIIYIGDGGLGVPQRMPDLTRWYLKSPGFASPAHHVHLIEFDEDEMRVTAIGLDREFLDHFVVKQEALAELAAP